MQHRAIETRYKGYRFRSRLEARWAVFFDALGLRWEYEPEGFELPSGRYLPDFKVHYPGRDPSEQHVEWFECKGDLRTVKHEDWARMLEFPGLVVLDGVPDLRMYLRPRALCSIDGEGAGDAALPVPYAAQVHAYRHERCGLAVWCGKGRMWWDEHGAFFDDWNPDVAALRAAVDAARSARFEHGESGAR